VWRQDEPVAPYLVLAAVGRYDLVTRPGPDGTTVTLAFPHSLPAAQRKGFDALDAIAGYFDTTFGPLPGTDLGAIVVDKEDLGLALETQTRPLFGLDAVVPGRVDALAHELGHQWFGDDVSVEDWQDLWLNEGFATYADWLFQAKGGRSIDQIAADAARTYQDEGLTVRDPDAVKTFNLVVYYRGALALHALRRTVGDDVFFRILRTWSRRYSGRNATTEDFVALASDLAGRDLRSFFHAWLDAVPQPKLPG
jgi:aminopeptidase N